MNTYKRHRFPPEIISYTVWLYYRFNLSHRDIEDLIADKVSLSAAKQFAPPEGSGSGWGSGGCIPAGQT